MLEKDLINIWFVYLILDIIRIDIKYLFNLSSLSLCVIWDNYLFIPADIFYCTSYAIS
jgi:hypothetical protein